MLNIELALSHLNCLEIGMILSLNYPRRKVNAPFSMTYLVNLKVL